MKNRIRLVLTASLLTVSLLSGFHCRTEVNASEAQNNVTTECTEAEDTESTEEVLADGVYTADFITDSGMFHANEAMNGKGTLTVEEGQMTIHVSLVSKKIKNLFPGTAEQAQADGAVLLEPTIDTVTYSDGYTEEVFGFDIPVPALNEDFDCALIGEKGVWYDHKVSVANPVPAVTTVSDLELSDGVYFAEVSLEGGSGKAYLTSPCRLEIKDGQLTALIEWSSPNYDFMIVDDIEYLPVNTEGNSQFEIPVTGFDGPVPVSADTVAMGTPHLIDYRLTFDSATLVAE